MAWYNTAWRYRQSITISGSSGAGTGYQVVLKIGESSGATGYNFQLNGHSAKFPSAKNDGGDLVFTASDGITLLNFWVESVSGTSPNRTAVVWIKVSADLGSNQTIYCYYGNANATSASNGDNTFLIFDDFNDNSLDTTKWTKTEQNGITYTEANDQAKFSGTATSQYWIAYAVLTSNTSFTPPFAFRAKKVSLSGTGTGYALHQMLASGSADNNYYVDYDGAPMRRKDINGTDSLIENISSSELGTSRIWEIVASGGQTKWYEDGVLKSTDNYSWSSAQLSVRGRARATNDTITAIFDFALVRKYVSPEPAFSSSGGEELLVTVGLADSLSGSESIGILNSFGVSDTGTGFESGDFSNSFSLQDSAVGTELLLLTLLKEISDTLGGLDDLTIQNAFGLTDSGTGNDDIALLLEKLISDQVTGTDLLNILNNLSVYDLATGIENVIQILNNLNVLDASTGIEIINLIVSLNLLDSAVGSEAFSIISSVAISIADSVLGSESLSISNELQISDSASVYEIIEALNSLDLNDFLSGSDFVDVSSVIQRLISDSAVGSEILSVLNDLRLQDNATVSEIIGILTTLSVLDNLIGLDKLFASGTPGEVQGKMKVLLNKFRSTDLNKDGILLNKTRETMRLNKNKLNKNKNREVKLD